MSSLYHLMVGPQVLLDPRLVAAAVRSRISCDGPPNQRPQIVVRDVTEPDVARNDVTARP